MPFIHPILKLSSAANIDAFDPLDPFRLHNHEFKNHPDPPEDSCCICYHAYSFANTEHEAEDPFQLAACGHVFGAVCITRWAQTNKTCPLCRTRLEEVEEGFIETSVVQSDDSFRFETTGVRVLSYAEDSSWHGNAGHDTQLTGYLSSHSHAGYNTNGNSDDGFFSWQSHAGYESDGDSDNEYCYVLEQFDMVQHQPDKDIRLSAIHNRQCLPGTSCFSSFDNKRTDVLCDDYFNDLVVHHQQWMTEARADNKNRDELDLGFDDVFLC